MTKLSVNINKIATLRNSRGGNNPDVLKVAQDCERFGAQGITVHPRPDERHIRYQDVLDLQKIVTTEFNIEGYPDKRYMELVARVKPVQATLVPDKPDAITSNAGWDTLANESLLREIIAELKRQGIRTSIFVDPVEKMVEGAARTGADRIEFYTESYAKGYSKNREKAIAPYALAARVANTVGLGIHALVCDALYLGLENTIQLYLRELNFH
jgi:pyridoxine 5-phosphate synthase